METFITRKEGSSSGGSSKYNAKFDYSKYATLSTGWFGSDSLIKLLVEIDLKAFDNTSKMTKMDSLFSGFSGLQSLDLSSFNTSKVTNMDYMFYDCKALKTLYVRSEADKAKLTASKTKLPSTCTIIVGKPSQ